MVDRGMVLISVINQQFNRSIPLTCSSNNKSILASYTDNNILCLHNTHQESNPIHGSESQLLKEVAFSSRLVDLVMYCWIEQEYTDDYAWCLIDWLTNEQPKHIAISLHFYIWRWNSSWSQDQPKIAQSSSQSRKQILSKFCFMKSPLYQAVSS